MFGGHPTVNTTPVLVLDSLGFADRIRTMKEAELRATIGRLQAQYDRFRAVMPNRLVIRFGKRTCWGTREFETFRLNDMFVVYSRKNIDELPFRYLIMASLSYQQLILDGFVPRGGLGLGVVGRSKDMLFGSGFIDAYEASEMRSTHVKGICAVLLSKMFLNTLRLNHRTAQLLRTFKGEYFLHPYALHDPDIGEISDAILLEALKASGANREKLDATHEFLLQSQPVRPET